jgi:membrane protease YdiL (CAAX protease family)
MTASTARAGKLEATGPETAAAITHRHAMSVAWFVGLVLVFEVAAMAASFAVPSFLMLALVFGPAVIAIVLARREGNGAVRQLFHGLTVRPDRARWYLAFSIPVIGAFGIVALAVAMGLPTAGLFDKLTPTALIIPLVVAIPAFVEEFAWRGFALRRLLTVTSPWRATLILGVPWTAIHLALYLPGQSYENLAVWPVVAIIGSYSVLLSWLFVRTGGSVLMTGLFHTLLNGTVSLTWGLDPAEAWADRGIVFAAIAVVVIALGGFRSISRSRIQLAAPVALIVAAGLMAACSSSPAATVAPATAAPTPAATVAPAPATPTPAATVKPGSAIHVVLAQATGKDVTIDVTDASGSLLTATSGTPGDGASVEPYKLVVSNDNPTTLRLTWVGGPCDSANTLSIDSTRHQFLLVQPECAGDSIATDRILVLTFDQPISATDIEAFLQDGLDT